jgi:integrase
VETFKDYAEQDLAVSEYEKAHSTFKSERSKVKNLINVFGKLPIEKINHSAIKAWRIKAHKKFSNKTINEHMIILRSIFASALADGLLQRNPTLGIENLTINKTQPVPFERDELIKLHNVNSQCDSGKALALLGVLTGLRPSELFALTWDCINLKKGTLHVNKAKVLGKYKVPKTRESIRVVELNQHAILLLENHFKITGSARYRVIHVLQQDNKSTEKQRVRHVFINTKTNKSFIDSKQYGKAFFTPFLIKAKVKHRGPSQLRHTFASQCLTAGISIVWIAKQMGHTSTKMVEEHYAKWITNDAPDHSANLSKSLDIVFGKITKTLPKTVVPSVKQLSSAWSVLSMQDENVAPISESTTLPPRQIFAQSRCAGRGYA